MKKKAQKLALIDYHTLKALIYFKRYDRILRQAIIDKVDLNTPYYTTISNRVDKLVKYLDNYIIYNNEKSLQGERKVLYIDIYQLLKYNWIQKI